MQSETILITDNQFKLRVYAYMSGVNNGKVVSYSQVAVMCGHPGAARVVGQIAHFGPPDLPWHRLVHASGSLAGGYVPGGALYQMKLLQAEGVQFKNDKVIMKEYQL